MTLRWIEGFETTQVEEQFNTKYESSLMSYQGGETFPAGRVFGSAFRAVPGFSTDLATPVFSAHALWVCGLAFRSPDPVLSASYWNLFLLYDSGTEQLNLHVADGATGFHVLQVRDNLTILGQSDPFPATGDWQYVEWKVLHHLSAGTVEVRLNKVVVISLSGINTAPSGVATADQVVFGVGALAGDEFDIDDVYILDGLKVVGLSSPHTDFLGPIVVKGLLPVEDALPNDMTPLSEPTGDHHLEVDDAATVVAPESTYNEGAGGDQEFYDFGSAAEIQGGVLGVQLDVISILDLAGAETLQAYHRRKRRGAVQDAAQSIGSATVAETALLDCGEAFVVQADPFNGERLSIEDVEHGTFGVEAV